MSTETQTAKRLSLSDILKLVLARPAGAASHVGLSRNAKGETQIDVVVTSSDAGTIEDAERLARETYERLLLSYPPREENGDSASVALSRNAKGETQIEVIARGDNTPEFVSGLARVEFDRLRTAYPMSTGFVGAQPPAKGGTDGGKT